MLYSHQGHHGIEIAGGSIMLVTWRIKADPEGNLKIERSVMRGPVPLESYGFPAEESPARGRRETG
jgi:hypothetical protein